MSGRSEKRRQPPSPPWPPQKGGGPPEKPPGWRECEMCGKPHNGKYGAGRFCSAKCAKTVGGLKHKEHCAQRRLQEAREHVLRAQREEAREASAPQQRHSSSGGGGSKTKAVARFPAREPLLTPAPTRNVPAQTGSGRGKGPPGRIPSMLGRQPPPLGRPAGSGNTTRLMARDQTPRAPPPPGQTAARVPSGRGGGRQQSSLNAGQGGRRSDASAGRRREEHAQDHGSGRGRGGPRAPENTAPESGGQGTATAGRGTGSSNRGGWGNATRQNTTARATRSGQRNANAQREEEPKESRMSINKVLNPKR